MKSKNNKLLTIKQEMFLLSFIFLIVVSVVFTAVFTWQLYERSLNAAKNILKQCNSQIVTFTESMFNENETIINMLVKNTSVIYGVGGSTHLLPLFDSVVQDSKNITHLYTGYEDGRIFISDYDIPKDYKTVERPWYQEAKKTDGVACLVHKDAVTGEWLFSQCRSMKNIWGDVTGVIAIDSSNDSISNQLSTKYQFESQRSYIVNTAGTVLIHPQEKYINDAITKYIDEGIWNDVLAGKGEYGEYKKDGINSMAYFESIPNTGFIVITAVNASEVLMPIKLNILYLMVATVVISIMLGIILTRILIFRFARPIIALESRIRDVANGENNNSDTFDFSNVEIREIADSIEIIVKDIANREERRKAAEYMSFHDSLTGVYNRRFFEEELERLDKKYNYPLCIMCCDVNCLKKINDIFGHDAGDALIISVTEAIGKHCRIGDTLARIGGDEFSVIMPRISSDKARRIISDMKLELSKGSICGVDISASIGYAVKESEEEPIEEIIQLADKMMYAEKMREGTAVRQSMLENIIKTAEEEGVVSIPSAEEGKMLAEIAKLMCPGAERVLRQVYMLRNIGQCTKFLAGSSIDDISECHTERGFRILNSFDRFRNLAGYVLHYTEHWDGSGMPLKLSGRDIPLISGIVGAVDAYFSAGKNMEVFNKHSRWYNPEIIKAIKSIVKSDK